MSEYACSTTYTYIARCTPTSDNKVVCSQKKIKTK